LGLRPDISPTVDNIRDPWLRKFPRPPEVVVNTDNEVTAWHFTTTVNSYEVVCRIFND